MVFSFFYIFFLISHYFIYFSYPLLFSPHTLPPPEKRPTGLFHQITKTHGTVIGVSSGIVLVLLIISILVQMKQPRKKVTHPLWPTFCPAGNQTLPEEKRHTVESDGGIKDVVLETRRVKDRINSWILHHDITHHKYSIS